MKWSALLALSLASGCLAGYTATSRASSLQLTEYDWSIPDVKTNLGSTTAMGPFSASSGGSSQVSSLQPLGATYSGSCAAHNGGVPPHSSGWYTTSSFELRFTLAIPTVFHIDGSIQQRFNASATLLLQGIGSLSSIKYQAVGEFALPPVVTPVHLTGTLPAGNYRLKMLENGGEAGDIPDTGSSSSFIFTLDSCAGDLNRDALVDDSDFSIFVAAYNLLDCADPGMPANCPSDLNHDGFVDDADFVTFVIAYDALLCP